MVDQIFITFLGPVTSFFVAIVMAAVVVVVGGKLIADWSDRR